MSTSERMLAELLDASEWGRAEQLEKIAAFYGPGFADLLRKQVDEELARRAGRARKRSNVTPPEGEE